jgi:hypothetical protein
MPVTTTLGRLRQKDWEFKVSLTYIERPCLKKKTLINPTLQNTEQKYNKIISKM